MTKYFLIIYSFVLLVSCNNVKNKGIDNYSDKVDSILWTIIKRQNLFYYSNPKSQVFKKDIKKQYLISSKEFYPEINLTIEHRVFVDPHHPNEIIICYDSTNYFGIAFCDIHEYSSFNNNLLDSNNSRNKRLANLYFEKDLNIAVKHFKNKYKQIKPLHYSMSYEKMFVNYLMHGIYNYHLIKLDYPYMCYLKTLISSQSSCKCQDSTLMQLELISKDLESRRTLNDYYYADHKWGIYKFIYSENNNNPVKVEMINSECVKDFIL